MGQMRCGRVVPLEAAPFWGVEFPKGIPLGPVGDFLVDFWARGSSPASVKSYAADLLRWFRFLDERQLAWQRVETTHVREFVVGLRSASKANLTQAESPRRAGVNPITGKAYLPSTYSPRTINHNLSVVSEFYEYQVHSLHGPLLNPVPQRQGRHGLRFAAHHNPMDPITNTRRASFRQKDPKQHPRSIPEALEADLFSTLSSNRDRALVSFYITSGARPSELLGMTNAMVSPGEQTITVRRKGSGSLQRIPASPEAFVWFRLYQESLPAELTASSANAWWTLRLPHRELNYEAARAVIRRANFTLGTNWTLHDFRHTAALRWSEDNMSLTDISHLLGHQSVETTQIYLGARDSEVIARAVAHQKRPRGKAAAAAHENDHGQLEYDPADLDEILGARRW
jgi:site-specific recombinase XerD